MDNNSTPDVVVHYNGSIVMVECATDAAMAWVKDNLSLESWQWMGRSFSCEPRYIDALVEGMDADGLTVR